MGVELDDERVGRSGQLIVDGQRPQVVARDPQQEVFLLEDAAGCLPRLLAPVVVVGELGELELAQAELARIGRGAAGSPLALVVGEQLAQRIREQPGAVGSPRAAEQVERKDDRGGVQSQPSQVSEMQGVLST
jgi:hypothetical protein